MKKDSRPQYARIRRIIDLIRAGMETGRYANASLFAREFNVSVRTAMRDLDFLRDEENAPIEYDASRKGYYLSDVSWNLPPLRLSRKEVFAFSVAAKLLRAFHGTPLEVDMAALLDKIGQSMEGTITLDPAAMTEHMSVAGEDYVKQDPATWTAVAGAIDLRERMAMRYQKFNGAVSPYEFEPYHLLAYHGNWYAIGRNVTGDRVATFAVSRIREIKGTGRFFVPAAGFDIREYRAKSFGIVRGDKVFRVHLLFSPVVAAYIRERIWHPSQRMVQKRNGGVELILETAGWKELVRWILSWQPDCRVLSPVCLRKRVEEKMREALA